MNMILLTPLDLLLSASLVVALAIISWREQLGLERRLLIAALRTTLQLLLIGWVLKLLFEQVNLLWITLIAMVMIALAGYEIHQRQKHRFHGPWGYGLGAISVFISGFTLTLFSLLLIIQADPWYQPQYAIPLLGMLLGNTMNGISLGLDQLNKSALQQRRVIEARLLQGHSAAEAILPYRREAVRIGMIPTINGMAAAGIISLPGMMTGQILAGAAPVEAVKYQILIMFLVAVGTGFGTLIAISLAARRLFDERERLRVDRLT